MSNSEVLLALITELRALQNTVAELASKELDRRAASGTPIYPGLTAGRVLFAGANKELDDDAALVWDDTNKRLGVGVTPTAKLDVMDGYIRALSGANTSPASGKGLELVYPSASDRGFIVSYDRDASAFKPLSINSSGLSFGGGGNVGVNTSTPNRIFSVNNTTDTYLGIEVGDTEQWVMGVETSVSPDRFACFNAALGQYAMMVDLTTNYWRIGDVTTPGYRLELPNTASAAGQGRANAWATYSSKTFKKAIKNPDRTSHKRKVKRLRTVEYEVDLPAEDGKPAQTATDISLIAEEVREVWPELVTGDPTRPETLGLKLDRIGVVLLPEVQEHDERLDALEGEVTRLKQAVAEGQRTIARQQELLDALTRRIEAIEKKK